MTTHKPGVDARCNIHFVDSLSLSLSRSLSLSFCVFPCACARACFGGWSDPSVCVRRNEKYMGQVVCLLVQSNTHHPHIPVTVEETDPLNHVTENAQGNLRLQHKRLVV